MKYLRSLATIYDTSPQRQTTISRWLNRLQFSNQRSLPVLLAVILLVASLWMTFNG